MKRRTLAIALIVLLPALVGAVEQKNNMAIADFSAVNAPATEAAVLSEFVRSAVINSGEYTVVDKKNMEKLLAEQAFQQTGCTSDECAVKLGKVLNVRKMIVGTYSIMGETRFLTARIVDVETGQAERSAKVKGFSPSDADSAAERLVANLMGRGDGGEVVPPAYASPAPAQEGRPAAAATSEAPRKKRSSAFGGDMAVYLILYGGGSTGKVTSFEAKSGFKNSYTGKELWTYKLDGPMETVSTAPALGIRIGVWERNVVAFDVEFSRAAHSTVDQKIYGRATGLWFNGVSYTTLASGTVRYPDDWLMLDSYLVAFNLFLHTPEFALQPYAGLGFGVAIVNVSSEVLVDDMGNPLDETKASFALMLTGGLRFNISKSLFVFGEGRLASEFVSDLVTGTSWAKDHKSFTLLMNQFSAGLGFTFN